MRCLLSFTFLTYYEIMHLITARHNKTIYLKIIHAAIHEIESLRSNNNAFYFTYLNNSHLRILSMCKFIILGTENSLSPK